MFFFLAKKNIFLLLSGSGRNVHVTASLSSANQNTGLLPLFRAPCFNGQIIYQYICCNIVFNPL